MDWPRFEQTRVSFWPASYQPCWVDFSVASVIRCVLTLAVPVAALAGAASARAGTARVAARPAARPRSSRVRRAVLVEDDEPWNMLSPLQFAVSVAWDICSCADAVSRKCALTG